LIAEKMRTILIVFFILFVAGCSKPKEEIELTRDNFLQRNPSKVKQAHIISHGKPGTIPYSYDYTIEDNKKITKIVECINTANPITDEHWQNLWGYSPSLALDANQLKLRQTSRLIVFETPQKLYSTRIGWDSELVYGKWWESSELMESFRQRNLFDELLKADPNWPLPDWMVNRQSVPDSNFHPSLTLRIKKSVLIRATCPS
jgi:hypothetical protein